ncbi:MAG: hydrogenase maturation protein [Betaproteobacteria bacterium]|nr:hydrogenase maturation protein [Betaproteobacteria bacterium]
MRILFLTHGFNSLTQRLFIELTELGHEISIEFDIADAVSEEAVALFAPDLIVAPYLRRAIPESIWARHVCLVVHPGIVGDRGPSALDWAIQDGAETWGVTVLQANAEMDAGDIWAAETFPLRHASKSSLYRNEVTEAAVRAVLAAVERFARGNYEPRPLNTIDLPLQGGARPLLRQADRAIDWARDGTVAVLRKINAADGNPGVLDELFGQPCWLFDAHPCKQSGGVAAAAHSGKPGQIFGRNGSGLLRKTGDGVLRIGHVIRRDASHPFKLPAAAAFPAESAELPDMPCDWEEIGYQEADGVGFLRFDFYNGAMSTRQCEDLLAAYLQARARPTRVIVLLGGGDFWSNGIHLNLIEAADSPADESWRNINAIDDLARAILATDQQLTIAALRGNAGAGGAFLALAADRVWARRGVLLNPHYKNMGNLYGSEYWTYSLPRRVGRARANEIMQRRLPVGALQAQHAGLVDDCFGDLESFMPELRIRASALASSADYPEILAAKRLARAQAEAEKPLAAYREEKLAEMKRNFYGFDPSYHVARYHFVYKLPHAWTPRHLAQHRQSTVRPAEG